MKGFFPAGFGFISPYSIIMAAAVLAISSPAVKKGLKGLAVATTRSTVNLALEIKESARAIKNEVKDLVTEAYAEKEIKKILG